MAVAYEQFDNDAIEAQSLQSSDSEDTQHSDQILVIAGNQDVDESPHIENHDYRMQRMHIFLQNKWPLKNSIFQLILGVILMCLGLVQIVVLPLINDKDANKVFVFAVNHSNAYGIGEWIGILFVLSGAIGLRAALYSSLLSLYIYFGFIIFELLALVCAILLLIVAYSDHWTTIGGLNGDKVQFYLHLSVTLCICMGFLVVIYSFLQYYEDVLFGEIQCCKRAVHCLLPCICPKPVHGHELLNETDERPPSLPV